MSQKADKNWGRVWSKEAEMDARIALQVVASSIYTHWKYTINQESKTSSGEWIEGVGLGQIHDIWNLMYTDMKALYTLEQIVGTHYRTKIIEDESPGEGEEDGNDD
ncbi:MAG: hypothetical protein K6G83_15920 [Lachnospiraceae bacterium]|nr:hypothetical protein [Lachnospiraceae bacterium]